MGQPEFELAYYDSTVQRINFVYIRWYKKNLQIKICTKIDLLLFSFISLVSLYNGISTFVGYLMPNPSFYNNSSGTT